MKTCSGLSSTLKELAGGALKSSGSKSATSSTSGGSSGNSCHCWINSSLGIPWKFPIGLSLLQDFRPRWKALQALHWAPPVQNPPLLEALQVEELKKPWKTHSKSIYNFSFSGLSSTLKGLAGAALGSKSGPKPGSISSSSSGDFYVKWMFFFFSTIKKNSLQIVIPFFCFQASPPL